MCYFRIPYFLFLFLVWVTPIFAAECSDRDREYAGNFGNYYDPEEARAFGKKIQGLVANKNLSEIFSLVDGELRNGPRKSFVAGRALEEVFDARWSELILSDPVSCSPVGLRGFMLGSGVIWYDKQATGWRIFAINGAVEEIQNNRTLNENDGKSFSGWVYDEKLGHPFCFQTRWMSGDNFKELAQAYSIDDSNFFSAPGQFYGNAITDYAPIKPSWCSEGEECDNVSLATSLKQCVPEKFDFEDREGSIWLTKSFQGDDEEHQYKILKEVAPDRCAALAPDIGAECKQGFLLSVGEFSGGSMGWYTTFGIYGLFDLPKLGPSIAPLIYFSSKNEALNFLDKY